MILIDRRTGSKDLIHIPPIKGVGELTDLEFGDAVVCGNGPNGSSVMEAFERKRLSDVLACIQDGRFAGHQLIGLREQYDFVWLLIEDEIRADPRSGILQRRYEVRVKGKRKSSSRVEGRWVDAMFGRSKTMMWRDFQHWLMSMRRLGGVDDVAFTRNAQETAEFVYTVHTWRQKPWSNHKSVAVFNEAAQMKRRGGVSLIRLPLVAEVAGRFAGVGHERAVAIGDRFKSVDEFMAASADELVLIEGIGKALANSIVEQRSQRRGR